MLSKERLLAIAGISIAALTVVGFFNYRASAEKIHETELRAEVLRAQRDSIAAVAQLRDSLRTELALAAEMLSLRTEQVRRRVDEIETGRVAAERAVWALRTNDETERAFREHYPEFAEAMRMTEYQPDPDIPSLRYVMLPAHAAQSFMVYRVRADSLELVRDSLLMLDSLNVDIIELKTAMDSLSRLNESAFRTAYDSAYSGFQWLSREYVTLARQPRFHINAPKPVYLGVSLVAGLALGFWLH